MIKNKKMENENKKLKIGIDIDEVVVEFVKGYLEIYNQKYNPRKFFEDIYCYDLWITC